MATIISNVTGSTVKLTVNIAIGDINNWTVFIASKQDHGLGSTNFPDYPYYVDEIIGSGTTSFTRTYAKTNYVAELALRSTYMTIVDYTYFDFVTSSQIVITGLTLTDIGSGWISANITTSTDGQFTWKINGIDKGTRTSSSGGYGEQFNVGYGTFNVCANTVCKSITLTQPSTTGTVLCISTPEGATIKLDNVAQSGVTPKIFTVTPGVHSAVYSKAGYSDCNTPPLNVTVGHQTVLSCTLTPTSSSGITITYPSSGATLTRGNTYNVTWTGTDSGSVKIQLFKDSVLSDTLMTSTLNDGTWKWVMSATSTNVGSGYTIKITHLTSGATGTSGVFNIAPASTITKYKCIGNVCTPDPTGTFTENTCGGTCISQPPVTCIPKIDEFYIPGLNMCVPKTYIYVGAGLFGFMILKK